MGAQRPEGVGHQRRHRRRPRRRRRRSTPSSARAATPPSSSRRARQGPRAGQKVKKHGIRASHTAEVVLDDCRIPGALPARRQGEARRAAGPRPRGQASRKSQAAMATFEATPPDGRRAGARHRPRRLRVRARLREGARAVRPADHREPGDRLHARRHEDGDRRRPAAGLARRLDGPQRQAVRERRGLDVASSRPARSPCG